MIYEICFSATGRTKKVADIVVGAWQKEKKIIDLSLQDFPKKPIQLTINDLAIVCVPSYGGRVPTPSTERLGLIFGNGATALLLQFMEIVQLMTLS